MDAWQSFLTRMHGRWQHIDKFLPSPESWLNGVDEKRLVVRAGGEIDGVAVYSQREWGIESPAAVFGALAQYSLRVAVTGDNASDALDILLIQWRFILHQQDGTSTPDSTAVVMWPSREVRGINALLAHGLQPRVALALCDSSPVHISPGHGCDPEVIIRSAGYSDLDSIIDLWLEVIEYDDACGGGVSRPNRRQVVETLVADQFRRELPWVWLATRVGSAIGLLIVDESHYCEGIAPLVGTTPISYISVLGVSERERGKGVGKQLISAASVEIERHYDSLKMLHYAVSNPMSSQFWVRMGYRPLWTEWSVTPAAALR